MADETPEGDVKWKNNLPQKVTVQQLTPCGDNNTLKKDNDTSKTTEGDVDIKTLCEEGSETLMKGHDGQLSTFGENDKNPYGDGNISLNRDKNSHLTPIGEQQNSARTQRYSKPTTLTSKGVLRSLERGYIECVLTLITDLKGGEEKSK